MEVSALERALKLRGQRFIAGCDEAGRGALAGPVMGAAVVLSYDHLPELLMDSKRLTRRRRELVAAELKEYAVGYATFAIEPREIERINILQASLKAMARSVAKLGFAVDYVLVDGPFPIVLDGHGAPPVQAVVDGDARICCIAAASILAKVERDFIMRQHARRYARYHFDVNMGYGTEKHLAALRRYGPCRLHRGNFKPVREAQQPGLFAS
jgi:ribonuclease HII